MAEKARMFGDQEMLACIMGTSYPKEMKAYGRAVAGFDKDTWEKECYEIVKQGNKAKFSQNSELLGFLTGTKNRILVETSHRDNRGSGCSGTERGDRCGTTLPRTALHIQRSGATPLVRETDCYTENEGHRPSRLYRRKNTCI